jgi:hypothetical protein
MTYAALGSPRSLVSCCKTFRGAAVTAEAGTSDFLNFVSSRIQSKLGSGPPNPGLCVFFLEVQQGPKTWPFCADFGGLVEIRATESMGLRV